MLSVRGLTKTYPNRVVGLRPTDLTLEPGERVALIGPSGSGKTTLLRLIAGLEAADAGEVRVGGVRVDRLPPHRRGVALLPQRPALYPHLTVGQNLAAVGPAAAGPPAGPVEQLLQLEPLLARYPHQLSGGERQRVALAKLLRLNRPVWLLDEPFSSLDPLFRSEFRTDLHLLLGSSRATIILVSHDPIDARAFGQRIGVLADGTLHQIGPADHLQAHPGNRFVAFCIGGFAFLDGTVEAADGGGDGDPTPGTPVLVAEGGSVRVPLPPDVRRALDRHREPAARLTLGLRPDDVVPRLPGTSPPTGGTISGWPLVSAEPDGSGWLLTVARGRTRVRVGWSSGSPPAVGALTEWTIPAGRGTWFDARTGDRMTV